MAIANSIFKKYSILLPVIVGVLVGVLFIIHFVLHVFGFETCGFFECTTVARDMALLLAFPGWIFLFSTGLSTQFETTNGFLLVVSLIVPSVIFYYLLGLCIDNIRQKRL